MREKELYSYIYLIPGILLMSLFVVVPVLLSFCMSFFQIMSLGASWGFVGFGNYAEVFRSEGWLNAIWRTLLYGSWNIVTGTVIGLLLAFCVAKHPLLNVCRYIFYLPSVVSAITMGRLWNYMLSPTDTGFFNIIFMRMFGLETPVNWLGDSNIIPLVVMALSLYGAGGGMSLILYTTAINNISKEMLEAAKMEGAGDIRIALSIELPMITPIISSMLALAVIGAFKNFEGLYSLIQNAPEVETIAVLLYKESIAVGQRGYGLASAMGAVLTLIVMIIMTVYIKWPQKEE